MSLFLSIRQDFFSFVEAWKSNGKCEICRGSEHAANHMEAFVFNSEASEDVSAFLGPSI